MKLLSVFLMCLAYAYASAAKNEQAELYMNLATEKYLQGEYQVSVDNLNKVLEIDKDNIKAKNLLVRVVIDGATDLNLKHEYPAAMKLLKRGREVAPDNERIEELYQITEDTLSGPNKQGKYKKELKPPPELKLKTGKQDEPEEKKPDLENAEVPAKKKEAAGDIQQPPELTKKKAAAGRNPVKKLQQAAKEQESPKEGNKEQIQAGTIFRIPAWLYVTAAGIVLLGFVLVIIIYLKYLKAKLLLEQRLKLEKSKTDFEAALEIERKKWELQKKESELEKLRLENKLKEEYGKKRAAITIGQKDKVDLPKIQIETKKVLISNETQDLKKTISNIAPAENIYISEANLEEIRTRIASRMQAIYEQSPDTAINFLKDAAKSPDEDYKSNIVKALSGIAKPETLDIMFELNESKSDNVRREVIKSLKQLSQFVKNGERTIPEDYLQKINKILRDEILKGEWIF